ncbi:MAG: hypothetical protein CFE34_06275 [Rhodobacteraceae bacterium PARR1]|nr:MAG: hypothetical protein CFE34_06275 [Rhodobacteraceae bacterium PARR1]
MVAQNRGRTGPGGAGFRPEQVFLIGLDRLPASLLAQNVSARVVLFSALNSAMLYVLRPDHVVCPLFGPDCDAAQLITRLHGIGYGGRLTVLAQVPNPAMVAAELAEIGPGIVVKVIVP